MKISKIRISPREFNGRYSLSGEWGANDCHVWINEKYFPSSPIDEHGPVIHINPKDKKGRYRTMSLQSKVGKVIFDTMVSFAKNHDLLSEARALGIAQEKRQAEGVAKRQKAQNDKKEALGLLVRIATQLSEPTFTDINSLRPSARRAVDLLKNASGAPVNYGH